MSELVTAGSASYRILDNGDLYTIREMYEMNVYRIEQSELVSGKKVLDIGANIGIFSVWAALQGASVVAYEPDPRTLSVLRENINRNRVEELVTVFPEGVMALSGVQDFFSTNQTAHSTFRKEMAEQKTELNPNRISVSIRSFDEVIGDDFWDVVKIDAEGAEYDMISSSEKLSQIKHLSLEWHTWPGSDILFGAMCRKLEKFFDLKYDPDWNVMSIYKKV